MNDSSLAIEPVKSTSEDDDRILAACLAPGDAAALGTLVERYHERVTRLAARLLGWSDGADDVAQEVFLAVWRSRRRFRGDARLWTYLATITVNRCRSLRRRRWLERRVLHMIAPASVPVAPASDRPAERDETAAAVRAAVAELPTKYREAIVLRYLEELPINEIADVLRIKRNAAEARLSRARKLLEQAIGHLSGE